MKNSTVNPLFITSWQYPSKCILSSEPLPHTHTPIDQNWQFITGYNMCDNMKYNV